MVRQRVFSLVRGEGLLSEERIRLLLSWRRSGFSVHTSVTVPTDDREGLERLARYLTRQCDALTPSPKALLSAEGESELPMI